MSLAALENTISASRFRRSSTIAITEAADKDADADTDEANATDDDHEKHREPQSESPFTRWRQLRNNPRFIEAVTDFCRWEDEVRYEIALDYAAWWPSNVRNFRFELLIILERDMNVELLIEREGRKQIAIQEQEEFYHLEDYWNYKQLFAFWPRWVEHAHSVISSQIWTLESILRNEFTHRMFIVDRSEIREREKMYQTIRDQVFSVGLVWGDFVPEKIRLQREAEAKRIAEIQAAQEQDVENLKMLYMRQIEEVLKQKWEDLFTTWEAGRMRILWKCEQEFDVIAQKCFAPSSFGDDADFGAGGGDQV